MTHRVIIAWWLALSACGPDLVQVGGDGDQAEVAAQSALGARRIRVMAGNLTSNGQAYDSGPGLRIFKGLRPDIALVQEFNYLDDSPTSIRSFVDQAFGPEFAFVRAGSAQQSIPNGIVSRFPVLASGDWADTHVNSTRGFSWALLDLPGPSDVFAVSVHFSTKAGVRPAEASALVRNIEATAPAGAFIVIGGDFNTSSRAESAIKTLDRLVVTRGPWPVDGRGNGNTNRSRSNPYDWVAASAPLHERQVPTVVGTQAFPTGLVVDTRIYAPLADIAPAQASDSAAKEMQHMGVVKDFEIAVDDPTTMLKVLYPNGGETLLAGSACVLRWQSSNVPRIDIEYASNGVDFVRVATGVDASTGSVEWLLPPQSASTAQARIRISGGALSDVSDAPFSVQTAAPPPARVMVNEVLANEPGTAFDEEFVELLNAGGTAAQLDGWTLSDGSVVRHVFPAGTRLEPGKALTVFAGKVGGSGTQKSSTGALGLSNGGDSVIVRSPDGVVDSVTYSKTLASSDGVSLTRSKDGEITAPFVLHTGVSSAPSSPGTRVDGSAF